jgi:soluble lytic murein transglycosylase-like protein
MVKSTHKTIQDYFKPARVPTRRQAAVSNPGPKGFKSILQASFARQPQAKSVQGTEVGWNVRDYMNRRLVAALPKTGLKPSPAPVATPVSAEAKNGAPASRPAPSAPPLVSSTNDTQREIQSAVRMASRKYGVPQQIIQSVIRCESNFNPDAVSHAGAQGLMQLMPLTAADLGVTDPFDIQQNVDGGTRYLREMLDRFEGNLEKSLAAYNAGPGTVIRYGGIPPYPETQAYVEKVIRLAQTGNRALKG